MALAHSTIDLKTLGEERSRSLARELYPVHSEIFSGLDEDGFRHAVFKMNACWSKLRVFRAPAGRIVGYAAIHRFERRVSIGPVTVFRGEAGLLPEFRAQETTISFYWWEFVKYRFAHPLKRLYYLGTLVHPSSYVIFARFVETVFPRPGTALQPGIAALMCQLADTFDAGPVDASDPLIRAAGWRTRVELPYWQRTDDADVVFFRRRNPGYRQGHGLVVLIPLTFRNLLGFWTRYASSRRRSA